jgi:hypothetical protein
MAKKENSQNLPPAPPAPGDLAALAERLLQHADRVTNSGGGREYLQPRLSVQDARPMMVDLLEAASVLRSLDAGLHVREAVRTFGDRDAVRGFLTKLLECV